MNCLSPSILSADFANLGDQVRQLDEAGAQYLHIDVMDGVFVPNITFGPPVIKAARQYSERIFDVHLMVQDPSRHIASFAEAGADLITVHVEACTHLDRAIRDIREHGILAGVAINPATPVSAVECVLPYIDMVLVMTVNPGFGGQDFIPYTLEKVRELKKIIDRRELKTDIEVDGGISLENVGSALDAGANVIVTGSAVFDGDLVENTQLFLDILSK